MFTEILDTAKELADTARETFPDMAVMLAITSLVVYIFTL